MPLSLLAQVPPVVGDNVVVDPIQIGFDPVILTEGFEFTVTVKSSPLLVNPPAFFTVIVPL
jgi:hypothetical protein